ncbi:MAG: DUF2723 domain-containing protein [candidate division Zixibacteria bacterium]|nr:DUF2723 domain-containing protein [candidate division Zixibacteria bacterium]
MGKNSNQTKYSEQRKKRLFTTENALCASVFLFFLAVYTMTLCPTIFWWDSAEFVAAIASLGIPHPPSFPLYILLGKVFSFLPLKVNFQGESFFSLPFNLNILSGIFSALSLAIFFLLFLKISRTFFSELVKNERLFIFSSILLLLVAGLNHASWIQGVRAEVYSLNGLIFVFLFFCGLNFLEESNHHQKNLRWLYLFFFIIGLGMGNHNVTLISIFPAFIFLFVSYDFHKFLKLKNLGGFLLFFLLGCSIYLYLPFRAVNFPALNWGNPVNLEGTLTSALALKSVKQIGFALNYTLWERTKDVWLMIYSQFTFLPFLLSLTGLIFLLKKNFKLFVFLALLIIGNCSTIIVLPSEFISTSSDFQGYVLPTIFSFAFLFGLGVLFILKKVNQWVKKKEFSPGFRKSLVVVFSSFFFSISILPFLTFYRLADLSKNDLAYRYGKGVLSQVKRNAVLFIDNPNLYFILCALKYGEGYRKDIAVLDRGLLRSQWNFQQESRNYPELFSGIHSDLRGEDLFLTLMSKSLRRNMAVYMEFTERDSDLVDLLSPAGYLFKVEKEIIPKLSDDLLAKQKEFENKCFLNKEEKTFENDIDAQRVFALSFYRLGLFYEWKGMTSIALDKFAQVRKIDPENEGLLLKIKKLEELKALSGPSHPDSFPLPGKPSG